MGVMRRREARRQCKEIIDRLDIPAPFNVRELCARIAHAQGRPIELCPLPMPPNGPSGVWIATEDRDYIFFEERTATLHQEHIIVHELGHLLAGHGHQEILNTGPVTLLLPDLDPEAVSRILERTAYTADEERIAEMIATLILKEANRWKPVSEWEAPADGAEIRRRVHLTFEALPDGRTS